MYTIETYRGHRIYKDSITSSRLYVSGKEVSCLQWWYNIEICRSWIDWAIKYKRERDV